MRQENIQRLKSIDIPEEDRHYLVYKFYHSDLFNCLKKYSTGRLLDIGCGNKPYSSLINPLVKEYIGCDIVQSSDRCVDVLCPATDIPLESEGFDTIISTQTIEHVAEHQLLINEAYRLLKKDGAFIISGPMYWPLHEEPFDFFRFTKYGFRHLLEKAGFEVLEERANGGKWAVLGQVFIQTLYPDLTKHHSLKWKTLRKFISMVGGIKGINRFFARMDEKYLDESNTLNYVFVAKK